MADTEDDIDGLYQMSDDDEGFYRKKASGRDTDKDRKHKDKKSDRKDPKKDKDKKDDKKLYATRTLVRGEDGLLRVQYTDPKTGEPITGALHKYEIVSNASTLKDIYPGRGNKRRNKREEAQRPTKPGDSEPYRDPWDHDGPVGRSNTPTSSSAPQSGFTSSPSPSSSESEEQGDQEGNFEGSKSSVQDPDYGGDFGLYDPTTGRGIYGRQNLIEGVAAQAKEDAQFSSLDDDGFDTIDGNNFHSLEGQNLNDITSQAAARNNWSVADRQLAAQTLAGEIDQRKTDLSTPEGIAEAKAIMSTMENRDLANGPNEGLADAINAPKAYSTWNNPQVSQVAIDNYNQNPDLFDGLVNDYVADPNSNMGFTNYHANYVNPGWSKNLQNKTDIGPHHFGVDPSIANKIPDGQPLTEAQKNQIASDIVNQSFAQSFAAPVGPALSAAPPTIDTSGIQTDDMASGLAAQRDYMGPAPVATPIDRIVEAAPANGPLSTPTQDVVASINNQVAMDNAYGITQGQQISSTPPGGFTAPVEVATRNVDISGQTYTPDPGLTNEAFEDRFANTPGPALDSGITPSSVDTRMSSTDVGMNVPGISPSSAGVYGDPTTGYGTTDNQAMGFGDYVKTDPAAANPGLDSFGDDVATSRVNSQVESGNQSAIADGSVMSSEAPDIDTPDVSADATSAGAGSNTASVGGGELGGTSGGFADSGGTDSGTDGGETGGTSSGGTSGGGFADSPDVDSGDDGY